MSRSITRAGRDEPFGLQVAKGEIAGHTSLHKFGANAALNSSSYETIWREGGRHAWVVAGKSVQKISSSSTNDDVAGTGALTVSVQGVDEDYAEISETVILTGQTAALTTKEFLRVHRMVILSAGTGLVNAGIVYAGTGAVGTGKPAVVNCLISIGACQSEVAYYTVPAGKTLYVSGIYAGIGFDTTQRAADIVLYARPLGEVFQLKFGLTSGAAFAGERFDIPLKFDAKTDIDMRGLAVGGTPEVRGGFEGFIIKND